MKCIVFCTYIKKVKNNYILVSRHLSPLLLPASGYSVHHSYLLDRILRVDTSFKMKNMTAWTLEYTHKERERNPNPTFLS